MLKYIQSIRDEFVGDRLAFQETGSVAETLNENSISYPFIESRDAGVELDSIQASSGQLLWKEMNKLAKKLSAKLDNQVQTEGNRFVLHHSFKITGVGKGESHKYIPFTLTMDDGQTLTALAKNVSNLKTFNPKKDLEITHWFINKKDATAAIYKRGDRDIDTATTVMRLKALIELSHKRFVSSNPDAISSSKEVKKLEDEINSMELDLSDVVWNGSKPEEYIQSEETKAQLEELSKIADQKGYSVEDNESGGLFNLYKENGDSFTTEQAFEDAKKSLEDAPNLRAERDGDNKDKLVEQAFKLGEQAFKNNEPESPMNNNTFHKFMKDNKISVHLSHDIRFDTRVTTSFNDGYDSARDKAQSIKGDNKDTYKITLPKGAEKYLNVIKNAIETDEKTEGIEYEIIIDGTVMDAVDKKEVDIEGLESSIKTRIKQIVHFITIGADKIEGKENVRMPSVSLIRNAEYIKDKTGLDYKIEHQQGATFRTATEEFQVGDDGRAYSLMLPIGRYKAWSVKERWLSSDMSRKYTIERIKERLEKEKGDNVGNTFEEDSKKLGFVGAILKRKHTISNDGKILTAEDGKRYHVTEDYHGEEGITDLTLIENDIEVTDENLPELYPSMTPEQKDEWGDWIEPQINKRTIDVRNTLFEDLEVEERNEVFREYAKFETNINGGFNNVGWSLFGVKDNLEPIDEYIAKIKKSDQYMKYLAHKANVEIDTKKEFGTEYADNDLVAHIKANPVYKQVIKDSHGGVIYNTANIGKYDATEILALWEQVEHKNSQDGIIKGAMNFLLENRSNEEEDARNFYIGKVKIYFGAKKDLIVTHREQVIKKLKEIIAEAKKELSSGISSIDVTTLNVLVYGQKKGDRYVAFDSKSNILDGKEIEDFFLSDNKTNTYQPKTEEFLSLTIDDLDRAMEIMEELGAEMEKDSENTELQEAYEAMNKHLDGMVG